MAKLTLNDVISGYASTTLVNANNTAIETAFENTLSRDGTGPNQMETNLDMNGYRILNQANPITISGLVWEGPWVTGTTYQVGDIIETGGSSYICIVAHTASPLFTTDSAYWQTVVTAVYPDQAGQANKFLQTNGITPSWKVPDASEVSFTQSGTGAVTKTAQAKMRDVVSVFDFMTTAQIADVQAGTLLVDVTTAIQAAIDASRQVYFPAGKYKTTATLTAAKTCKLSGAVSSFGDATSAAVIVYDGTAAAISITPAAGKTYNSVVENIVIQASGAALASATAIGLLLTNSNYAVVQNVVVREFGSGIGIKSTATLTNIGAYNHFIACMLWGNKTGYSFGGAGVGAADYASVIMGGTAIGPGTAGSVGLIVDQYAAETMVYGTDFESFDVCIDLYGNGTTSGGGVKLIGTRTEFQTTMAVRVNANTDKTQLVCHRFAGGSSATWLSDSGTRTFRTDVDSNIRINAASLELLNNIPINLQESGGTSRTVFKMATNDTVQFGSSVNGNYGLGTWYFTSPHADSASGPTGYQNPVWFGTHALWVDSLGVLRIKNVAPTSDTDGTVVGTQT